MALEVIDILNQGSILHMIIMGAIFVLMAVMISKIGNGVSAKSAVERKAQPIAASVKTGDAVTAAITAAISEYRKNN